MQPILRQVPPMNSRSMQAVLKPNWAARMAAIYPPGPAPMTIRSNEFSATFALPFGEIVGCGSLDFQHEPCGVFEELFDSHQEADGFFAVDDAVVVGEGEVHHGADGDLVVD